ncbi:hypothetical protein [Micromonospora polyrhachis]|uniref:Uncharacterized protein n=1 Tax=Micromonospora polyrhachis TaxID=1282883 RepID=A0A7W7WS14_9ACTN|nr:hypothetical protein [Micromonospora polyrhachis]
MTARPLPRHPVDPILVRDRLGVGRVRLDIGRRGVGLLPDRIRIGPGRPAELSGSETS